MLRVSIFQRLKSKNKNDIGQLYDKARNKRETIITKSAQPVISKIEQEVMTEELKQISNINCVFSTNRKKEITCSRDGKFNVYGNPTKKCEHFPCSFYENIAKSTQLIHDGADQFGIVKGGNKND